jgi:protoporphyrinogen oxidase
MGAGPAGLTLACRLKEHGINDFLVLEAEDSAGGLCRSVQVDGSAFDTGGGHFLDVRRPEVDEFLFRFMPRDEWDLYERDSRIDLNGQMIHHPLEANIWEMDTDSQVEYLKSIAAAGCNTNTPVPEKFVDWIYWKLGTKIAEDYMIPYNSKMFGENLDSLGIYWLSKLPDVSFEDTLRSCLTHRAYARQPGHAQFYYPKKYGYGEVWLRMAESIRDNIRYNERICGLDALACTAETASGTKIEAEQIITTIPWAEISDLKGVPSEIKECVAQLRHSSVVTQYFPENMDTMAQWIYYPDPKLSYHRILVRHNFCPGSRGFWTETNAERSKDMKTDELHPAFMNKYAYPLNTINKPAVMERLLGYMNEHRITGLGRWGEHRHYNSDAVCELAMKLGDELAG